MRETREESSRETTEGGEKTGVEKEREIKKNSRKGELEGGVHVVSVSLLD